MNPLVLPLLGSFADSSDLRLKDFWNDCEMTLSDSGMTAIILKCLWNASKLPLEYLWNDPGVPLEYLWNAS